MAHVQTRAGHIGYRDQLDRVRRFLERVEGSHASDVAFQDIAWSFFQHCWHLRDWVKHDPLATQAQKDAVKDAVHRSALLRMCGEGTKHLQLDHPKAGAGARPNHVDSNITPGSGQPSQHDCLVDDGRGNLISGKQLARDSLAEWERILQAAGLAIARMS